MNAFPSLTQMIAQQPGLMAIAAGAIGACIGSFLNVCIHRLPKGESIVTPSSRCACGQPIPFWFNLPLLGWILLRGKANCCGAKISVRYPLIELLTASAFACSILYLPLSKAIVGWVFLSLLILLSACDLEDMLVPDAPNFALVGLGVIFSILIPSLHLEQGGPIGLTERLQSMNYSLLGVAVGTATVWWIRAVATAILGQEAMGEADIILCAGVGAFCGFQGALFCLFGGAVIGVILKLPSILRIGKGQKQSESVPFVPSMAMAGALWFFNGPALVSAWFEWASR